MGSVVVMSPDLRRAARYPDAAGAGAFTAAQDRALTRLIASSLPARQIVAELRLLAAAWGRDTGQVCDRVDWLIGPAPVELKLLTPTERALTVLCGRAREDARTPGGFRLDGRPAAWREVIAAANRVLKMLGREDQAILVPVGDGEGAR